MFISASGQHLLCTRVSEATDMGSEPSSAVDHRCDPVKWAHFSHPLRLRSYHLKSNSAYHMGPR